MRENADALRVLPIQSGCVATSQVATAKPTVATTTVEDDDDICCRCRFIMVNFVFSVDYIYIYIYKFSYIYILWMHFKGISLLTSLRGLFLFGCEMYSYENRNLSGWNLDSCNENFFDVSHLQELVTHFYWNVRTVIISNVYRTTIV